MFAQLKEEADATVGGRRGNGALPMYERTHPLSLRSQTLVLLERRWAEWLSLPRVLVGEVLFGQFVAVLTSIVMSGQDHSEAGVYNRIGWLNIYAIASVSGGLNMIPELYRRTLVFTRERDAGAYGEAAFWLSSCMAYMPKLLVLSVLNSWGYFVIGMRTSPSAYFFFLLTFTLLSWVSFGTCLLVSGVFPTLPTAMAVLQLTASITSFSGGFFIRLNSIPVGWRWLSYVSSIRWFLEAASVNELEGYLAPPPPTDASSTEDRSCVGNSGFGTGSEEVVCDGDYWLEQWDFTRNKWLAVGMLACVFLGFAVAAYWAGKPAASRLCHLSDVPGSVGGQHDEASSTEGGEEDGNKKPNKKRVVWARTSLMTRSMTALLKPRKSDDGDHNPRAGIKKGPSGAQLIRSLSQIPFGDKLQAEEREEELRKEVEVCDGLAPLKMKYGRRSSTTDASKRSLQQAIVDDEELGRTGLLPSSSAASDDVAGVAGYGGSNRSMVDTADEEAAAAAEFPLSEGCEVLLSDLNFRVKPMKGRGGAGGGGDEEGRLLLRDVSASFKPGQMCAILGASGAGKSTLLDVIAGRAQRGDVSGEIRFNGRERDPSFSRSSAYVMQDDVHIAVLSVEETLQYAALLRMDQECSNEERADRVSLVVRVLGLQRCLHTRVGGPTLRGVSGGERKRLSIGVEIINLPDLIFLDEPTTGLDSSLALALGHTLHTLAAQRRTILSTIHQPSPELFGLFDQLLLLAGGRCVYAGPACDALPYFTQHPLSFPYAEKMNPAEFVILVAGGKLGLPPAGIPATQQFNTTTNNSNGRLSNSSTKNDDNTGGGPADSIQDRVAVVLERAFNSCAVGQSLKAHVVQGLAEANKTKKSHSEDDAGGASSTVVTGSKLATSVWWQLGVLSRRAATELWRERSLLLARYIRVTLVGIIVGTFWWQLGTARDDGFGRISLFVNGVVISINGQVHAVAQLIGSRLLYVRERGAGAYSIPAYFGCMLAHLPANILECLVYSTIVYWCAGLRPDFTAFVTYYLLLLSCNLFGLFYAQLCATVASTVQAAMLIFNFTVFLAMVFGGFNVRLPTISAGSRWMSDLSVFRWPVQGMMENEFHGQNIGDMSADNWLTRYGFDGLDRWESLLVMVGMLIATRVFTYLSLRRTSSA